MRQQTLTSRDPSTTADAGVTYDFGAQSRVLVITVGGLFSSLGGTPPFEFFRVLDEAGPPPQKIFVRDHQQAWYHRGVRDFASDIDGVVDRLRNMISECGATKVVILGSSAGGYGALLFGRLLGEPITEVHAFAPQSFINPLLRARHLDTRWKPQLQRLRRSGAYERRYGDLLKVYRQTHHADSTKFVVHYARDHRLDAAHAEHIGKHQDVTLNAYLGADHNFVKRLRDDGTLQPLLRNLLTE